jgi:hypothetical protein
VTPILWIILALLIAAAIVFASSLKTRRSLPPVELPDGETMPVTPLQRHARRALFAALTLSLAAAACVAWFGPQTWWEEDPLRLAVTAMMLGALLAYLYFTMQARSLEAREDGSFDERDQAILARSSAGVGGAMIVVLAAWMIGLTETHVESHLVPTYFLYLIFWSCILTNVIASLAGVLLAYRRS